MVDRPLPSYREIRREMLAARECSRCGACCELAEGSLSASAGDVRRWIRERRSDILRYVRYSLNERGELAGFEREIWLDPRSSRPEPVVRCPFLTCTWETGFRCAIWPTRPAVCADFECGGERCETARRRAAGRHGA